MCNMLPIAIGIIATYVGMIPIAAKLIATYTVAGVFNKLCNLYYVVQNLAGYLFFVASGVNFAVLASGRFCCSILLAIDEAVLLAAINIVAAFFLPIRTE